ncbi:Ribose import ATP-binding protein RbsA [Planctomycetes bacterium Pan216]|uniref:Ribose import ATP-binding protein RbsA n=1 Tax=Kolteria novifilia TaxID=2527975 RepID=A0A518B4K1_9BACT|nr:Ribose import ATP-binding protein RbsA [Planctomycetes bacterium Pan216]
MIEATQAPRLRIAGIEKSFPGVRALRGVDLELQAGEVVALLGENGAGKSTLIKILGGAIAPDAGTITIEGTEREITSPVESQQAGIAVIYQEFNLIPALSARENIFLGQEPATAGFIHGRDERRRAKQLFDRIGVLVDLDKPCRQLSIAQQQAVEIAKALALRSRIIVMDEPSATLTPHEVESLFAIIRELKEQGIGVIYVSHRLDEIFAIADRVLVMRDGERVGAKPIGEVSRDELIEMMVGRALENEFPKRSVSIAEPRLVVRKLSRGDTVREVSFDIRRGELVALTGLVGAGRTETARLIFGADRAESGSVSLDGKPLRLRRPADAIRAGICLLTEDRKDQGLVLGQSVLENFTLPNLPSLSRLGFVLPNRQRTRFASYVDQLGIKLAHPSVLAKTLSGGNQQKVVLAKWLETNSEVVIFDEPTRGIDVGAKFEIYELMNRLVETGKSILMISSELPEVLGMADRILVMHGGSIVGEIDDVTSATQEQIMALAVTSPAAFGNPTSR